MQPTCYGPLHEHHTPTRFCSFQFCPWKQLYLDTRKWAGLWDMWISHPQLDSHNHWQYVSNLLEETAVNGFHVHWKWPNLHVWKTSSSPQKGASPEDALHPLPWILRKRVCTLASRQKDLTVLKWTRSLSSLSSRKTVWCLNVRHAECVHILKSLFRDLNTLHFLMNRPTHWWT